MMQHHFLIFPGYFVFLVHLIQAVDKKEFGCHIVHRWRMDLNSMENEERNGEQD